MLQTYLGSVGRIMLQTYLGSVGRYAADTLEVDRLHASEEAVLVDEVLHHFALLAADAHALVLTLVQVVGRDEVGVGDQLGAVVKQVAAASRWVHLKTMLVLKLALL